MHIQDINKLLNLQDINIVKISDVYENSVEITLEPLDYIQNCPCCNNRNVIRKGSSGYRKVRHYFTRNRDYYEARIFLECNKRALTV